MDSAIITAPAKQPHWLDTFMGVLLSPQSTFAKLSTTASDSDLAGAFGLVCLVFALDGLKAAHNLKWTALNVSASILLGAAMWICLAGLLAILAVCFKTQAGKARAIFVTTGWAFTPWIFMSPLWCYKQVLSGSFIIFAMLPMLWVFLCQLSAIKATFELKNWQLLALVFLSPALWQMLNVMQFLQSLYVVLSATMS